MKTFDIGSSLVIKGTLTFQHPPNLEPKWFNLIIYQDVQFAEREWNDAQTKNCREAWDVAYEKCPTLCDSPSLALP